MVNFLDIRDPQAFLAGMGMLVILSTLAVAVLDGVVIAGLELLVYFFAVRAATLKWRLDAPKRWSVFLFLSPSSSFVPRSRSTHVGGPLLSV